jgi:cytochrome P450
MPVTELERLDRDQTQTLFTPATVTPPARRLSSLGTLAAMHRNALEAMDAELFSLPFRRGRMFGKYHLVVCEPALMQAVLLDHADAFGRSELQERAFRPAIGEGLLLVEGAEWRSQRRAASPAFRYEALRRMTPAFQKAAEASAARLCAATGVVDVEPEMRRATLEVVMDTLLASYDGAAPEAVAQTLFGEVVVRPTALDMMGAPQWVPAPGRGLYLRRLRALRAQAREAVRRRRATDLESGDLLGALMAARDPESGRGLSDQQLVDNIVTFIGAGHETTAVTLTWALYLIANAPGVQARLVAEAEAVLCDGPVTAEALAELGFHEQVLNEALRLFTPGPLLPRAAVRDVDLGPVQVKAGSDVFCNLYVLHRSPSLWADPAAFDPDRFSPERSAGRHRFAFIPFGAGPRVCIGARFAMLELKTFLATFVRAFTVEPASAVQPLPQFRLTTTPRGGMPLRIRPRN